MTATIIRMPVPNACRFAAGETAVLWRLQEGMRPDAIASELGLAEPMVKEYIKAILKKVRSEGAYLSATMGPDEQPPSHFGSNSDRPIRACPTSEGPLIAELRANHRIHPSGESGVAMMTTTDPHHLPKTDLVEHRGYQIRFNQSNVEWIAFVARPKQRPTVIMAPYREAVLAKAYEWIDRQRASGENPK